MPTLTKKDYATAVKNNDKAVQLLRQVWKLIPDIRVEQFVDDIEELTKKYKKKIVELEK